MASHRGDAQCPGATWPQAGAYKPDYAASIAARIRVGRAALGWSQGDLASQVGIGKRTIASIELAASDMRRQTYLSIMRCFEEHGVTFEDLSDGGFLARVRRGVVVGSQ